MPHLLKSANTPGKELECLLIFDPDTQEYWLERQHSSFHFQRIRKQTRQKRSRSQDSHSSRISHTEKDHGTEKDDGNLTQDDFDFDVDLDQVVAEAIDTPVDTPASTPPKNTPQNSGPRSLFHGDEAEEDEEGSSSAEGE
jgi:hypothetical protein